MVSAEWEAHEPGFFSVALFDHRGYPSPHSRVAHITHDIDMPICDGVEAAKRLRNLESKRKVPVLLPSKP